MLKNNSDIKLRDELSPRDQTTDKRLESQVLNINNYIIKIVEIKTEMKHFATKENVANLRTEVMVNIEKVRTNIEKVRTDIANLKVWAIGILITVGFAIIKLFL